MGLDVTTSQEGAVYQMHLRGEMTIYTAATLKPQLLNALAQTQRLDLNLGEVSELDTAGVQLLVLTHREAAATGKTLRLVAASPAVRETVTFYRLESAVGLDNES